MVSLKEITYRIYNHVVGGRGNNNEFISFRQIEFDIYNLRALLIRRWLESDWRPQEYEQQLSISLVEDTTQEGINYFVNDIAINQESIVYRSTNPIPSRIRVKNRSELTFIGYGHKAIDLIPIERLPYVAHDKWTGKNIRASIINDYIYVIHPKSDEANLTQKLIDKLPVSINEQNLIASPPSPLTVRAIFENPHLIEGYVETDYPCSRDMADQMIEQLIQRYSVQQQIPSDKVINDDKQ